MPTFIKNWLKRVEQVWRRFPLFCIFWGAGATILWLHYSSIFPFLRMNWFVETGYLGFVCLLCAVALSAFAITDEVFDFRTLIRRISLVVLFAFFAWLYFFKQLHYLGMIGLFIAFRLWANAVPFLRHSDDRLFLTYLFHLSLNTIRVALLPGLIFFNLLLFTKKIATGFDDSFNYLLVSFGAFVIFGVVIPVSIAGGLPKNPIQYAMQKKRRTWIDHLSFAGLIGLLLIALLYGFFFFCAALTDFVKGNYIWGILIAWPVIAVLYWILAEKPRLPVLVLSLAVVAFLLSVFR